MKVFIEVSVFFVSMYLIPVITVKVILWCRDRKRIRTITAQTEGMILQQDNTAMMARYVVRFKVDEKVYEFREFSSRGSNCYAIKVPVHYDPDDPRNAWAETPTYNRHMKLAGAKEPKKISPPVRKSETL